MLGSPEEGNQQPSPGSDPSEGSTTSSHDLSEIMKDHERAAPFSRGKNGIDSPVIKLMLGDDIVWAADNWEKTAEAKDKEP